jgi:hypothetical protein
MKSKYVIAASLLLIVGHANSQEDQSSRIYELISNVAVTATDVTGTKIYNNDRPFVPPYKSKFAYIKTIRNDSVLIRFLSWVEKDSVLRKKFNQEKVNISALSQQFKAQITKASSLDTTIENTVRVRKYFLMSRSDFDSNAIKIYPTWHRSIVFTLGLVTMPLKLRPGKNFDFQGNLSLGTTAGIKMRMSKYNPNFLNVLLGASISAVTLDSFSTKGKVTGQPLTNQAVFSPSIGMVFEFGKAQAGLFYGWDLLNKSTDSQYSWIHNGKPWISIGFGFSILSINSKSQNANAGQNTSGGSEEE